MGKTYVFSGKSGKVVITEGDAKAKTISGEAAAEIDKLLTQRRNIGLKISKLLKSHGLMSISDDETTVTASE